MSLPGMASLAFAKGFPWPEDVSPPSSLTAFFNSVSGVFAVDTDHKLYMLVVACSLLALAHVSARFMFFHSLPATSKWRKKIMRGFCWLVTLASLQISEGFLRALTCHRAGQGALPPRACSLVVADIVCVSGCFKVLLSGTKPTEAVPTPQKRTATGMILPSVSIAALTPHSSGQCR